MSKKWLWLAIVIVIALVAWLKWQPKTVEGIQVSQGNISQTIVATGRVAPLAKVELASLITAQVAHIHVREGDVYSGPQFLNKLPI